MTWIRVEEQWSCERVLSLTKMATTNMSGLRCGPARRHNSCALMLSTLDVVNRFISWPQSQHAPSFVSDQRPAAPDPTRRVRTAGRSLNNKSAVSRTVRSRGDVTGRDLRPADSLNRTCCTAVQQRNSCYISLTAWTCHFAHNSQIPETKRVGLFLNGLLIPDEN